MFWDPTTGAIFYSWTIAYCYTWYVCNFSCNIAVAIRQLSSLTIITVFDFHGTSDYLFFERESFGTTKTFLGSLVSNYCLNMPAPRTAGLSILVSFVAWPGVYTAGVHPDPGRLVPRDGRLTWLLAYLCTGRCYIMCTYSIKEKKVLSCLFSHLYLYDTR